MRKAGGMTEPTTVEILRAARALIATPDQWTQGTVARDKNGRRAHPESPAARQWCAAGACIATGAGIAAGCALDAVARSKGHLFVTAFNDDPDTTHTDVLALYDRAIALAGNGGAV